MCMAPVCEGEYKGMYVVCECDWIRISALWGRYGCAHSHIRVSVPVVWTKSEERRRVPHLPGHHMSREVSWWTSHGLAALLVKWLPGVLASWVVMRYGTLPVETLVSPLPRMLIHTVSRKTAYLPGTHLRMPAMLSVLPASLLLSHLWAEQPCSVL